MQFHANDLNNAVQRIIRMISCEVSFLCRGISRMFACNAVSQHAWQTTVRISLNDPMQGSCETVSWMSKGEH